MKKKLRSLSASCAAAAVSLFGWQPAQAGCCVFDSASIVSAVGSAAGSISSSIATWSQTSTMQIVAAIKGAQAADASATTEAAKLTAEATVRAIAEVQRVELRGQLRTATSNPCSVAAVTAMSDSVAAASVSTAAASVGRDGGRGATSGGGGSARLPGASSSMQRAIDIAKGNVPAPPPEAAAVTAADAGCGTFAAGSGRTAQCRAADLRVGTPRLPDADIKADTIMDGPQGTTPRKRYSIDLASEDRTAVEAYLRNINPPPPLRALSPGEIRSEAGRGYIAAKDAFEARMSMAERPVRRHIARIAASRDNIPYIDRLIQSEDKPFVEQFLAKHSPEWRRTGVSLDEMMQIEVQRRFMNPEWQKRVVAGGPDLVQREQLQLVALQTVLLSQVIEELRENSVAQAASNMAATRTELMPLLRERHAAAAR